MEASKYDEELEDLLPEIEGDESEIIEETNEKLEGEVRTDTVLSHLEETEGDAESVVYGFFGEISEEK
ncbi:MAG: hypothetical protein V5A72_03250 [Candidatus Nanohaloarchaea archaeon]